MTHPYRPRGPLPRRARPVPATRPAGGPWDWAFLLSVPGTILLALATVTPDAAGPGAWAAALLLNVAWFVAQTGMVLVGTVAAIVGTVLAFALAGLAASR